MLPNFSALSLNNTHHTYDTYDTGAKMGKEKQLAAADQPYVKKVLKEFDTDDMEPVNIKTYAEPGYKSSQAERKWLQTHYGNDWSNVNPKLKERLKEQARKALSYEFAPKIKRAIVEATTEVSEDFADTYFTEAGRPKLDWATEVRPRLQAKYPPNWTVGPDGKLLSEEEKNARSEAVKEELRAKKLPELQEQRQAKLDKCEEEVLKMMIEQLNNPDEKFDRRARALLRHWFNRKGTDGKMRVWYATNKKGVTDVPKEMAKARLNWAKAEVAKFDYNSDNPPRPPLELYLPLDVKPVVESFLPDGVEVVSDAGGQWLWIYMRALEQMNIESIPNYGGVDTLAKVEESAKVWLPEFREEQKNNLKASYQEFIESVDDMSNIPGAKDVAKSYTASSSAFNKYLLWPSSKINGDPTKIPTWGSGAGGVAGATSSGDIGPPKKLHQLYKLINRCPRLDRPTVFLRAVLQSSSLPHNLGKKEQTQPVIGRGYLNVTFMSTSSAGPNDYLSGALSTFYINATGCCMYAITAPKGTPVLPLVLGGSNTSEFATEQEVVFPPGLVLVYQGAETKPVGSKTVEVHFYHAMLPPKVEPQLTMTAPMPSQGGSPVVE